MALPIIAAGIAARAVAKKIATRVAGGITGAGAKNVAPINRNMGTGSVKVVRRDINKYPDDLDKLRMIGRPKASAPIESLGRRSRNAIKIKSNK